MRSAALLLGTVAGCAAACSFITDLTTLTPAVTDAGAPDAQADSPADAPPAPRCNPSKPFGPPQLVQELSSSYGEASARLLPDELTLYMTRTVGSQVFVFRALRSKVSDPFSPAVQVSELGGGFSPSPTSDGLTVYFMAYAIPDGGADAAASTPVLFVSQRANANAMFGAPSALPFSVAYTYYEPYVLPDATALYYVYGDPNTNAVEFARATVSQGEVTQPVTLTEFASTTSSSNISPVASADELTLYYAHREVTTANPNGVGRVSVAHRASVSDKFSGLTELTELDPTNPAEEDSPSWISPDGCVLYLDVTTDTLTYHVFRAQKP